MKLESTTFDIETFETTRASTETKKPQKLSRHKREQIVRGFHTRTSMVQSLKEIEEIKNGRSKTDEQGNTASTEVRRTHAYKAPFFIRWFQRRKKNTNKSTVSSP